MPEQVMPDEFPKIIKDFLKDIKNTFPEYSPFISKWWKGAEKFDYIQENDARAEAIQKSEEANIKFIFNYCCKKYPPRFFDLLYKNNDIFKEDSETDTEFLPYIHFKNLWNCDDISDKTRETIWKYLQLILFSIVGSLNKKDAFGDTAKLFEAINEDEFKNKLEETLNSMQDVFKNVGTEETNDETGDGTGSGFVPNADDIHSHISGMLNGKLGDLAKEIAEETAAEFNLDMEGATNAKDVFQNLFKNPGKLMGLVKNVGEKLDTKMKSGEINESELIAEAGNIINQMKNMPGMGDIQQMLSKMGMGGMIPKGAKLDLNAMESKLNQITKSAKMKERMMQKSQANKVAKQTEVAAAIERAKQQENQHVLTDAEIDAMFCSTNANSSSGEKKSKKKKSKK